jgi:TetR/AcrR family transcriptional regulator, cholesterol catabolism regulator
MKSRILFKGTQLFFRYGIKSVTMDSIASELGISKKTIYQHFPDKDSMVLQVVECFIEEDLKKWEDLDAKYSNVIEKMFKSFEMLKEMLENMNPRLLYEIQKYFPDAFQKFIQYKEETTIKKIQLDFSRGIEEGYFRSDIDVELLARLRMAEVDLAFNPDFYPNNKLSLFETQLTFSDIFMRGILTEKGLKLYNSYQTNK